MHRPFPPASSLCLQPHLHTRCFPRIKYNKDYFQPGHEPKISYTHTFALPGSQLFTYHRFFSDHKRIISVNPNNGLSRFATGLRGRIWLTRMSRHTNNGDIIISLQMIPSLPSIHTPVSGTRRERPRAVPCGPLLSNISYVLMTIASRQRFTLHPAPGHRVKVDEYQQDVRQILVYYLCLGHRPDLVHRKHIEEYRASRE